MIHVLHGDCLDLLRGMPDNTVDAIVTDPPYGLEFMGKDWDSFKTGRSAKYAKGGDLDAEDIAARSGKGGAGPSYVNRPAKRCAICGKQAWSGSPCTCPEPMWTIDNSPLHAFQAWCEQWTTEALRVLKPGGHMLAFGGTRTWHRLACAIEDAGFEIRDNIASLVWAYGSGFPKSVSVGRAIMKAAGLDPDVDEWTPEAEAWRGHGTALKPSHEPIIVARKPLAGTVAANVAAWGTGAINIDASRVSMSDADKASINAKHAGMDAETYERPTEVSLNLSVNPMPLKPAQAHAQGRWPSNLILSHAPTCGRHLRTLGDTHCRACNLQLPVDAPCEARCADGCPVAELDQQAGPVGSNSGKPNRADGSKSAVGIYSPGSTGGTQTWETRQPGASRFFPVLRYQPKAPARERPKVNGVAHSTVKPLALMRWLVKLVTPPGGVILDMFAGSGTTGEAAALEGFDCILIEREATYLPLIAARLERVGADYDCPTIADTPQDDEEQTA